MKYDIAALKRKMLVKYPFFGSVVASVDYKETRGIQTAGTDGKTIYYNPDYLESLSVDEQTFVFAHEVCHIAFNHILRSEGKDANLWNTATDAVINAFLKRDGLKMISGAVDIADAINYDAEQLYNKLLEEKKQQNSKDQQGQQGQSQGDNDQKQNEQGQGSDSQQDQNSKGQQGHQEQSQGDNDQKQNEQGQGSDGQQDQNSKEQQGHQEQSQGDADQKQNEQGQGSGRQQEQDVGHDTHSMWEDAVKKHHEEKNNDSKKESLFDKLFNREKEQKEEKTEIEKKQEECEKMGEKDAFKKNLEDKKRELEELKQALCKQVTGAGTTTNRDVRTVSDIGKSKPLIDWRYVLREAIKYDVDWSYKNVYIEDGVVTANLEEQPMPETEILLDTSGSIAEVLLKNFLRECKNILQYSKIKVGCFDTEFYGFHEIRTEEDIENMTFEGDGGTDFDVAVGAFSRRVENKIIFTDGDANMPDMPMDAIWIVFGNEKINPKGGRVIYITPEQLEKLISCQQDSLSNGRVR